MNKHCKIANQFFRSIETGSKSNLLDILDPKVRVWHNNNGVGNHENGNDLNETIETLLALSKLVYNLQFEILSLESTDTGFVQQHVLKGMLSDGKKIDIPIGVMAYVENDRIVRVYEYFDSSHARNLTNAIAEFR